MSTVRTAHPPARNAHALPPIVPSDWLLMDNAGGTPPLCSVVEDLQAYLRRWPLLAGRHTALASEAADAAELGRQALASLCQADGRCRPGPGELVLGSSTTQLLEVLAQALAPTLHAGDRIIVSGAEHVANLTPWLRLARQGVQVETWPLEPASGTPQLEVLARMLERPTRLLCVTHASNVTGSILPIADISRLAHAAGALVCVDGVAYAPHGAMAVYDWDIDFYTFSAYKMFGPHCAALYAREGLLAALPENSHEFHAASAVPARFEPGGVAGELVYACRGLPDYFRALGDGVLTRGFERLVRDEQQLTGQLLRGLSTLPGVRILGRPAPDRWRLPIVSFTVDNRRPDEVVSTLGRARINIRHGHFYAPRTLAAYGVDPQAGALRISLTHRNTSHEVTRLLEVLTDILAVAA